MPRLSVSGMQSSAAPDMSFSEKKMSDENDVRSYLFELKAGRRELTGIMVARPETDGIRVVATTVFGMSLFDITICGNSYRVNSCTQFLEDRKTMSFVAHRIRKSLIGK